MNFITVNWELKDGTTASTLIPEVKADLVLVKLKQVTKAWLT